MDLMHLRTKMNWLHYEVKGQRSWWSKKRTGGGIRCYLLQKIVHCTEVHGIKQVNYYHNQQKSYYPVPAWYCATWHYPDPAGYYYIIWRDPGNFVSIFATLNYISRSATQIGHMSLMHDTVASCVTDNCPLGPSRGRADGNLWRDGLISHLTWCITMYVLTDEAIMQCNMLLLLQSLLMLHFLKQNLGHLLTELDTFVHV